MKLVGPWSKCNDGSLGVRRRRYWAGFFGVLVRTRFYLTAKIPTHMFVPGSAAWPSIASPLLSFLFYFFPSPKVSMQKRLSAVAMAVAVSLAACSTDSTVEPLAPNAGVSNIGQSVLQFA